MNIEKLLEYMEKRPYMFIGELNFDYLFHFINGFLYHKGFSQEIDTINKFFERKFDEWVQKWIENDKNILFEEERDYHYYIQNVCETQEECFELFFKLCHIFFDELREKHMI